MKRKTVIVADSSANLFRSDYAGFMSVPLKILTDAKEYVDDEVLDVEGMLTDLREYKGRSGTSCPSVGDWLQAFGDAEEVYGVSLTSHLSGCYNAASIAAEDYMVEHPGRKVSILDSLFETDSSAVFTGISGEFCKERTRQSGSCCCSKPVGYPHCWARQR